MNLGSEKMFMLRQSRIALVLIAFLGVACNSERTADLSCALSLDSTNKLERSFSSPDYSHS